MKQKLALAALSAMIGLSLALSAVTLAAPAALAGDHGGRGDDGTGGGSGQR
jgi:hypothetical protein